MELQREQSRADGIQVALEEALRRLQVRLPLPLLCLSHSAACRLCDQREQETRDRDISAAVQRYQDQTPLPPPPPEEDVRSESCVLKCRVCLRRYLTTVTAFCDGRDVDMVAPLPPPPTDDEDEDEDIKVVNCSSGNHKAGSAGTIGAVDDNIGVDNHTAATKTQPDAPQSESTLRGEPFIMLDIDLGHGVKAAIKVTLAADATVSAEPARCTFSESYFACA